MSQPRTSNRHPSGAFAILWVTASPVVALMATICSTNALQSLGVVAAWILVQYGANSWLGERLDDQWPNSGGVEATLRAFVTAMAIAAGTWPVMIYLLPEQLRSCSP